jgi:hypothetical protein
MAASSSGSRTCRSRPIPDQWRRARTTARVSVTYTLIAGIDLLEAVRRYGAVGLVGVVEGVAALPFKLHDRSDQPAAGPITFIELEGGAYWLTVGGDRQENFHYCAVPDRA